MTALDALRAGLRTLSAHPAAIAPYYLLMIGAATIARTPLTLGGGLAVVSLRLRGRIEPVLGLLEDIDPEAGSLTPTQQETLLGLVTPTVVAVVGVATLATVVLYVLCRGAASAGTIHALFAPLDGRGALTAGAAGISRDWKPFALIALARAVIYVGAGVAIALGIGLSATGVGVIVGAPLVLLSLAGLLVGHLLLAFAGQAVVVGERSAFEAIEDSVRFPLRAPTAFVLYISLAVGATIVLAVVTPLAQLAGVARVVGVFVALVIAPVIDAAKTGLYAGEVGAGEVGTVGEGGGTSPETPASPGQSGPIGDGGQPGEDRKSREDRSENESVREQIGDATGSVGSRLLAGQRRGVVALATFLRTHPLANLGGLALFLLGTGLGWLLTGSSGVRLDTPRDVAGVFGEFAVGPFVTIAANNWQVAIGQGFGGIAFGVPTVANLLFNGVLVGSLAGVFDRTAFLALVAPHGVVEIPALAVSGGVGLYLGVVGFQWARGRIDAAAVGEGLQRATWVLVGLLPLFVLAAFIEAFLTPRIAMFVLG